MSVKNSGSIFPGSFSFGPETFWIFWTVECHPKCSSSDAHSLEEVSLNVSFVKKHLQWKHALKIAFHCCIFVKTTFHEVCTKNISKRSVNYDMTRYSSSKDSSLSCAWMLFMPMHYCNLTASTHQSDILACTFGLILLLNTFMAGHQLAIAAWM